MTEARQHNRTKKFAKDFVIYSIGVLGSKLITFIMGPLYSHYVNPSDYGYFDLCLEFCLILVPVVTLQLRDGAFRFLLETNDTKDRTHIVTFVYRTMFETATITLAIAFLISCFYPIQYIWHTAILLIIMSFYEVLAQVTRGLGNNKAFISVGLIASFGIGAFSMIFVVWLKMGVLGIFIANILARLLSITVVELWMRTFSRFFMIKIHIKDISKELLKYSLPLVPVTLCGLLPPLSDRLFLKGIWSLEYAGIYAMAVRLAGIIHSLSIIFYQTWQENAIQQYNSPDRDTFFSKVFNGYIYILSIVLIGYVFFLKILFPWLMHEKYQSCLTYIYPIGMTWIIIAISNYFYLPYQCAKDTKAVVPPVLILAIANVTLNSLFVPWLGIWGVIATGTISYLIVTIYLWIDTRRYFTLHFYPQTLVPIAVILASLIPFYYNPNYFFDFLYILVSVGIILIALPKELRYNLINKIKK
ncbi:MAG: lipopolysaccharide biosynthesis protein [Muribaculaceae bacterium]|nr:lipopolysaccharide biosynthesis protein [Muribaculaceae bacterium]